jgi:adenosylcobinamide-GDP ribazoletransferase
LTATFLRRLTLAVAFLTRLPVRAGAAEEVDVGRSVAFFPLVGLVLGSLLALCAALLAGRVNPSVLAVLLVLVHAVSTGGLHLDGVADTFDGLGATGADRARRLEILRDSRIGAHGATALVLVLLLKVTALHALLAAGQGAALIVFPMVGRWAAVLIIMLFPYARVHGLGGAFHRHARTRDALAATAVVAIALLALGPLAWLAAAGAAVAALVLARIALRSFGGITGDVCGAAIELAEVIFLVLILRAS